MSHIAFPGHELRARREELGFSPDEVCRRSRVPVDVAESIESGAIHTFPDACYSVGFLKSYCRALGVEPNRYVDTYQACIRPSTGFLRRSNSHAPRMAAPPRWMGEVMAWASVCAVIALGWFTYTVVFRPDAPPNETRAHAATADDIRVPEVPKRVR